MYSTADSPDELDHKSEFRAPLAGYGYGLPLSRLYARYFGGDLRLISMVLNRPVFNLSHIP